MLVEVDGVDLSELDDKFTDGRPLLWLTVATNDYVKANMMSDLIFDKATRRTLLIVGMCTFNSDGPGPTEVVTVVEATSEEISAQELGELRELRLARSSRP